MSPWQVIEQLYDSEIDSGLQTDWDGGIAAWIGRAPRLAERSFLRTEFGQIAAWLDAEARRLFPDSKYANR